MERGLRWVAAVTAILSLIFGMQQLMRAITESNTSERRMTDLRQLAELQKNNGEYAMAWESINTAVKLAESGGTLAKLFGGTDSKTKELHLSREDIAMAWLDEMHVLGDQKFSDLINPLVPILEHGAIASNGQRKADLLAHLGWASFLRSREGEPSDPQRTYEQALTVDNTNPYAHAYLGHWMMWNGGEMQTANEHFVAALKADRATGGVRAKVRELQLAAYSNRQSEGDPAYVATVIQMLKNGESAKPEWRKRALWHFTRACSQPPNTELLSAIKKSLAPMSLVDAYQLLTHGVENEVAPENAKKMIACLTSAK